MTWCRSAVNFSFFRCLAACRTRSSPCDTPLRFCARRVRGWPAFPLVPALCSTHSAAGCPALFAGFIATMAESDFSRPFIIGYGSSPSRCGPAQYRGWSDSRSPGSRTRSVHACQVLRPRRVVQALAIAHSDVLPSATQTASAPRNSFLSRLNGWPARTPADASPTSSRMPAHGLGPMWFAIPSSQGTCTPLLLAGLPAHLCQNLRYFDFGVSPTPPRSKNRM